MLTTTTTNYFVALQPKQAGRSPADLGTGERRPAEPVGVAAQGRGHTSRGPACHGRPGHCSHAH